MTTEIGGSCRILSVALIVACGMAPTLLAAIVPVPQSASLTGQSPTPCAASKDRVAYQISGDLKAGERFEKRVDRFVMRLTPIRFSGVDIPIGWDIGVYEPGRNEDLSQFTLPLSGPNDRMIYAWHFRNSDNTGPNEGSVNAPQNHREFTFSPEVGRTILYEEPAAKMLANVARIGMFGEGTLDVLDLQLTKPERDKTPSILRLKFATCLTWAR